MSKLLLNEPSQPHPLRHELELAVRFAKEAGEIICAIRERGYKIWEKGGDADNLVTEADKAGNEYLVTQLKKAFPHDVVISEEGELPKESLEGKRIWFVDPIDGTKEFIKGINEWSVMIGLSIEGRPSVGVVYQPDLKQLYYAVKDGGSYYFDNKQIGSNYVREVKNIADAVLIQSRSHYSSEVSFIAEHLGIIHTIQQGSIGLKLGLIARGVADLYMNFSGYCHLWDVCGPELILAEAGGRVISASGSLFDYHTKDTLISQSFIASSNKLAKSVTSFIK